jgi:prophage antirepressor-like protein
MESKQITKAGVFGGKRVRRVLIENQWWFSVVDVCSVLIDSSDAGAYWRKLKQRLNEEGSEVVTFCHGLKLESSDGKKYETDCVNMEGVFRIIQSIPSKKVEPFKRWLAKVGKERIDEIENPELGMQRAKTLYEQKGYPKDWIDKRLRGIAVRQKLTDEWEVRGAQEQKDYAILTNEIMNGAFGMSVEEHKKHKQLDRQNLRDHMTDLELIVAMLGEAATTKITQGRNSQGVPQLQKDAKDGGAVAGRTRRDIERQTGTKVVSRQNFLPKTTEMIALKAK